MPRHDNESPTPPGPMAGAWRRCAIVALASAAILAAALPLQAQARCKITGMVELPVTMAGTRVIATVEINGAKVPLMVDSGAFYSMLTAAAAAQLKLPVEATPHGPYVIGITGAAVTHMTTVDKLHLLGGDIPDAEFLVDRALARSAGRLPQRRAGMLRLPLPGRAAWAASCAADSFACSSHCSASM